MIGIYSIKPLINCDVNMDVLIESQDVKILHYLHKTHRPNICILLYSLCMMPIAHTSSALPDKHKQH